MVYELPVELQGIVEEWTRVQLQQASEAIFRDAELSFKLHPPSPNTAAAPICHSPAIAERGPQIHHAQQHTIGGLSVIGGLDISFREDSKGEEGVAVLAVFSFPEMQLITKVSRVISLRETPYIPSYLSFREAEPLAALFDDLRASGGPIPQVLFVDGNGRWHVREAGSAVAVGLLTGVPTIGVAKEYHPLTVGHTPVLISTIASPSLDSALRYPSDFRTSQKGMRKATKALLHERGDWLELQHPEGEVRGAALLSSPAQSSTNPIFVSQGHRVSLDTALQLTLACSTTARVPEPVRQADALGRQEVRERWGQGDLANVRERA